MVLRRMLTPHRALHYLGQKKHFVRQIRGSKRCREVYLLQEHVGSLIVHRTGLGRGLKLEVYSSSAPLSFTTRTTEASIFIEPPGSVTCYGAHTAKMLLSSMFSQYVVHLMQCTRKSETFMCIINNSIFRFVAITKYLPNLNLSVTCNTYVYTAEPYTTEDTVPRYLHVDALVSHARRRSGHVIAVIFALKAADRYSLFLPPFCFHTSTILLHCLSICLPLPVVIPSPTASTIDSLL